MNTKDLPAAVKYVPCSTCMKEIPISEAVVSEAKDYIANFCGLTCYDKWKNQLGHDPQSDQESAHTT